MSEQSLFNRFKDKKVLITGSTGFKGSWLSIWLNELGAEVYGYALRPKNELDNFVQCKLEEKIDQTYADITDFKQLKETVETISPDYIFHLAAQALVIDSYEDPLETLQTNVMGTANILQAAKNCSNLKSVVAITSDKCYENNEQVWGYRENDELGGADPYSASKACAELVIKSFRQSFFQNSNAAVVSVRAGNVIGGGDWSANRLIPDIFKNQREGTVFKIRNPNATRPWQHVLEPLSGYLQLALKTAESKKIEGAWNFGPSTYRHFSVMDVVKEINKTTSLSFETDDKKTKHHEANLLKLDITKAANELNWLPQLSFEETIRYTVDGYLENENTYTQRKKQIGDYTLLAKTNKTTWAL
jgi:CDP-glucose 4,6-dehydratase